MMMMIVGGAKGGKKQTGPEVAVKMVRSVAVSRTGGTVEDTRDSMVPRGSGTRLTS